jgi:serine/threonine-protein kinase
LTPAALTAFVQPPDTAGPGAPSTQPSIPATSYLPPQIDPLLGKTLADRYLIQRKLGEGGMGAVYLATHTLLDKPIALKVLHGEFVRKPDLVERFMQEAKAASRIRHENVIDISDFGQTPDGLVFFAMELLKGHDLHEDIARAKLAGQLLPWVRSKKIFLQICAALGAAHKQGVIHRDLKPENVYLVEFLDDPDFVKLLDFGIAKMTEVEEGGRKLTKTGMLFGTPEYMSPEQARGEHVDARVDVYAMGCILFQLVTGRTPFEAENFMGVLTMHLTEPVPRIPDQVFDTIGAPRELLAVIDKALAKDRNQRWQTIEDFANGVRAACGDPVTSSGTATALPRQRAESVQAPMQTTTMSRQRTQWTGTLAVPVEDDEPTKPKAKSKLPLIIGALVLAGSAAAAAIVLMGNGGKSEPVATAGSASGSDGVGGPAHAGSGSAGSGSAAIVAPPPPDAAPVLEQPALPAQITITVDAPKGTTVTNLSTKTGFGAVGNVVLPGGTAPVQLQFSLKGHRDVVVDVVPDKDQTFKPTFVKGSGTTVVRTPGGGTTAGSGSGSAAATTNPTPTPTEPAIKPPTEPTKPPPPAEDDCPELPCLKDPLKGTPSGG